MIRLNPESHFYSEQITFSQGTQESFGPVNGNEANQFRTTASFTAVGTVKAYTICAGQVFIQPSEESGKINLILRPYRQPINGVSIKYFIYRGLNKNDFLQSDTTKLLGHNALGSASEFMNVIWEQLKKFNDWTNAQADAQDFLSKWIGFDTDNQPADSLIDDYFFMANSLVDDTSEELKSFEFPIIKRGVHLGNFTGTYGLDIVLSDGDYKPLSSDTGFNFDLAFARAEENILDVQNLPTGTSEKQYRETIFSFMDPAAYYGLHVDNGTLWIREGDAEVKREGQIIYDDLISKFHTKNNAYIYIQGNLGRSYNFYGDYDNLSETDELFKLGITDTAVNITDYTTNGWPVIIQNQAQTHTEDFNKLYLKFAIANQSPLCYGQMANLEEAAENNFLIQSQLLPEPTGSDGTVDTNYFTKPILVSIPATSGTGDRFNISTYVKLIYLGADLTAIETLESGEEELHPIKAIDTIFNPVHIAQRFSDQDQETISWSVSHRNNLVETSQISEQNSSRIVTQTKIIADKLVYKEGEEELIQDRVIYETQMVEGVGEGLFSRSNVATNSSSAGNIPFDREKNNFYRLGEPYYMETEVFNDGTDSVTGIRLKNYDGNLSLTKFLLGLTKFENDQIVTLIELNNLKNTNLFFEKVFKGESYTSFNLIIIGENNNNELNLHRITEDIQIYTIDNKLFYSSSFSKDMSLFNALSEIIPDFNL